MLNLCDRNSGRAWATKTTTRRIRCESADCAYRLSGPLWGFVSRSVPPIRRGGGSPEPDRDGREQWKPSSAPLSIASLPDPQQAVSRARVVLIGGR